MAPIRWGVPRGLQDDAPRAARAPEAGRLAGISVTRFKTELMLSLIGYALVLVPGATYRSWMGYLGK
jgi:hypothetical protein